MLHRAFLFVLFFVGLPVTQSHAAVIRFDFISEISSYIESSYCIDDFGEDACLGQESTIDVTFVLDVIDPDTIDAYFVFVSYNLSSIISELSFSDSSRLLSIWASGGNEVSYSARAGVLLSVRSIGPGAYDIDGWIADDTPDFTFSNNIAGWGGAGGNFYEAAGFWRATVVDAAPVPLPASGYLLCSLVLAAAFVRRRKKSA